MIIEGEFFAGGHLRWNLGWPTPNYAGAFLATVLALAFVVSRSRWRWALLAVESGGLLLLAKTYSRGALVALGIAWLYGVAASRGWKVPAERCVWIARVVILTAMMPIVGFGWNRAVESLDQGRRTSASDSCAGGKEAQFTTGGPSLTEDGSVMNRLALWRGGLMMIGAAPLTGWGRGESGRAYMNWFQGLDREESYTTMVNSYLHVAVERGLPTLVAALFGLSWLLTAAWRAASGVDRFGASGLARPDWHNGSVIRPALTLGLGASLVAWSVANVFTTLWIDPKLWIVPAAACIGLAWNVWRSDGPRRLASLTGASLIISVLVAGSLYGAGRWLLVGQALLPVPEKNGLVMLSQGSSIGKVWDVWPDPMVLGPAPGKELRRWLETRSDNVRLAVHCAAPFSPAAVSDDSEMVLLFGRQAELIGRILLSGRSRMWIVHPSVPPPSPRSGTGRGFAADTLILPQIDEIGNGLAWRHWARANGVRIVESPRVGQDIRLVWPAVMESMAVSTTP